MEIIIESKKENISCVCDEDTCNAYDSNDSDTDSNFTCSEAALQSNSEENE